MPHSQDFGNFAFHMPKPVEPPKPPLYGHVSYGGEIEGATFGATLSSMLNKANSLMSEPEAMTIDIASNPNSKYDIHDVMIAMGKSEVAFKLLTAITQKGINTFDKLTNIQI